MDKVEPPTKSAFGKARKKIPFALLSNLFDNALDQANGLAAKTGSALWNGLRLLAIDGTKKNLPSSEELREAFGIPHEAHYPQRLLCAMFDVLAKIPINMMWGAYASSERTMAMELIAEIGPGDLLLLDRGYPSFELFEKILALGADFLVRLPQNGLFGEVIQFVAQGRRDGKVTIMPSDDLVRERRKNGNPAPDPILLRVVKVRLPGKKSALFITSLTDKEKYPSRTIRELYHLRWGEEEFYKLVKELFETENFRGMSSDFIDQEVMAIYLYCLLARIMIMEAAIQNEIPVQEIQQQGAFLAVSRFLDKIWVAQSVEEL